MKTDERIKHKIPTRVLKLLSAAQPVRDRSGLLGQNAIKGIFVSPCGRCVTSMNGRMLIEVKLDTGLSSGQYVINKHTLQRSKYNSAFWPGSFLGIPASYSWKCELEGTPWPGILATFARTIGVTLDLADTSKPLDILCQQFKTHRWALFGNYGDPPEPILVYGYAPGLEISVYCVPFPATIIELVEGNYQSPYGEHICEADTE